ncbi:MAG: cobalamin biosynthesis protein CbiD [Nitrospinae bacterium]|nr:cobalamin biosynthesis protein CbiD [Nitrospinota bacterium]
MREGYTTGSCAAAGAKAAAMALCGSAIPTMVDIPLRNGARARLPVTEIKLNGNCATALVVKDSGDDPDITNGVTIMTTVAWMAEGDIVFSAGDGVGAVTKKGLSIPPGEPAINPGPREMIRAAVREVTDRPALVTVSIPGGVELAQRTFNPRLGIVGGLSVLGTTGVVRPYSHPALRESLKCSLNVAIAGGVKRLVFTAGNIGTNAAVKKLCLPPERIVEVSNEWGYMLDLLANHDIEGLLVVGHSGKLAKLPGGEWDTHSSRSGSAMPYVMNTAQNTLGATQPLSNTVEEIIESLDAPQRLALSNALAQEVATAISERTKSRFKVCVALVNMKGEVTGTSGDIVEWL